MRIWKWTLQRSDLETLQMPACAQPLTIQVQNGNGEPQLWALVDEDAPLLPRTFATYMTGEYLLDLPEGQERVYIGTYQLYHGMVFHVFELVDES